MDQMELIDSPSEQEVTLLGGLIEESRLYKSGKDYQNLLDFVVRLKRFAPFNAMLLQIQKPGLQFAAQAKDWLGEFNRTIKDSARPLLIMWPFGPVALVYDVLDTEGDGLPPNVLNTFIAHGSITNEDIEHIGQQLSKKRIELRLLDVGDGKAGSISRIPSSKSDVDSSYIMRVNKNHSPSVQLVTIVHELGHLFMGHLGHDKGFKILARRSLEHPQEEIEAESIAYLVARRLGVEAEAASYLSGYIKSDDNIHKFDIYKIMWAAGKIEVIIKAKGGRVLFKCNNKE